MASTRRRKPETAVLIWNIPAATPWDCDGAREERLPTFSLWRSWKLIFFLSPLSQNHLPEGFNQLYTPIINQTSLNRRGGEVELQLARVGYRFGHHVQTKKPFSTWDPHSLSLSLTLNLNFHKFKKEKKSIFLTPNYNPNTGLINLDLTNLHNSSFKEKNFLHNSRKNKKK